MSLFKVKEWWSNDQLRSGESNVGLQNGKCLKVDKFSAHNDSDCILLGDGTLLSIYKPVKDKESSPTLLETQFSDIIVYVETGKFTVGSEDRQIIVLHPQAYAIYQLVRKEGHTDAGEQNYLTAVIKHAFTRHAYSVTCGPFGNIKTRDLICIQGLDGSFSFFDQDTFLFMFIFNDIIIPSPMCYIANSDSFVICKSTWNMEIYSYQQLREFSEINLRQKKKKIPQWTYSAGEEITSVEVVQTSNNFSTIIIMCERHLYTFQDNGLMKNVLKFDFIPICMFPYLIGWFYEPAARLMVMVTSDDGKLYIYEGATLLWACELLTPVISICRCFIKLLPGGIVTLSSNGVVSVTYLGTEPDLNSTLTPITNETIELEKIQEEIDIVEVSLQRVMENLDGEESDISPAIEQILKVEAEVGKPVLEVQTDDSENMKTNSLSCPVIIMLTSTDPKTINSIVITITCCPPFICKDSVVCLEDVNGTEIVEKYVLLADYSDITDTKVGILVTVTDSFGKISVLQRIVLLPQSLYCTTTEVSRNNQYKIQIKTNHPCINLTQIFTDFTSDQHENHGNSDNIMTLEYHTKKIVTIEVVNDCYAIEANDFAEISNILDYFIFKYNQYCAQMGKKDLTYTINVDKEFTKQLTITFLKSIDTHATERLKLNDSQEHLNVLQKQFTLIQKKLLVQYGSLPPGNCDPLEFLMKDTFERLTNVAHQIMSYKKIVESAGNAVTSVGHLIIILLKQTTSDHFKIKLVEEILSLNSLYEDYQEWEESVTQGVIYFLNNVLNKSERDNEKHAPVTEQGILSHINLKRFLKQLRIMIETLFNEIYEESVLKNKDSVVRIEEIIEVL